MRTAYEGPGPASGEAARIVRTISVIRSRVVYLRRVVELEVARLTWEDLCPCHVPLPCDGGGPEGRISWVGTR